MCIFFGSRLGKGYTYQSIAQKLGEELASRKWDIVYGAGDIGLMGIIANAALRNGGIVRGVIPHVLTKTEIPHQELTELTLMRH